MNILYWIWLITEGNLLLYVHVELEGSCGERALPECNLYASSAVHHSNIFVILLATIWFTIHPCKVQ